MAAGNAANRSGGEVSDAAHQLARPGVPLCFGGSFDPPHVGHLITARTVAEVLGFEKVLLIPAATSPFKTMAGKSLKDTDRLALCMASVADDPMFAVDPLEMQRAGPSYTLETAKLLREQPPFADGPVPWLIGADLLPSLHRWHEADALLSGDLVQFIVMARGGYELNWDDLPEEVRHLRGFTVEIPRIEISSTELRRRLAEGRSVRYLMPSSAQRFIERHQLYTMAGRSAD
ncbi:MAG: nicotinate (nicotinamide) nucleotide adenylyltransferase [Planctomycetota bacterium]